MNDHDVTRPIPDPTELTRIALLREVANLRELLETKVTAGDEKLTARLEGMDKAIELIQRAADRIPSEVDLKTNNLQALIFEKFAGVATQFEERDTRTAETANLNKLAIDAALQAAKEAVGKTETAFTKQIDQLSQLIDQSGRALDGKIGTSNTTLDGKIGANKERLDRIEGMTTAGVRHEDRSSTTLAIAIGAVGLLIGLGGMAIALLSKG